MRHPKDFNPKNSDPISTNSPPIYLPPPQKPDRVFLFTKIFLMCALLTILIANNFLNFVKPPDVPQCITDSIHEYLTPWNQHLHENVHHRDIMLIISSFIMDILVLALCAKFILFDENLRVVLTLIIFFGVRSVIQNFWIAGVPEGYTWGNPGVFSMTVSYFPINDFFYSGHVGVCVIAFLEFRRCKMKYLARLAFFAIFMESFVMLVTKGHYTIDLIAGVVFAHYFYIVMGWWYPENQCVVIVEKEKSAEEIMEFVNRGIKKQSDNWLTF